ncbi:MerR family transcriptional regulator [Nocardiopsis composta]
MMNIGEFAQLTGLSTKALRIYDEQGLLRPASVDPWTGYRRYTAAQLAAAVRIKGMREAGVPLADAPGILAGGEQGRPRSPPTGSPWPPSGSGRTPRSPRSRRCCAARTPAAASRSAAPRPSTGPGRSCPRRPAARTPPTGRPRRRRRTRSSPRCGGRSPRPGTGPPARSGRRCAPPGRTASSCCAAGRSRTPSRRTSRRRG